MILKCKLTWLLELTLSRRFASVMAQLKRSISERGAPAYRGCGLISAFWRRSAPPIKRMERTSVVASKLAPPSAAHPQPRYAPHLASE